VDHLIGQGGMGEVYRGERADGDYEQSVAIKVLRAGFASQELMRRFKVERRILARLNHPHIVGILDGGSTTDGRPFLVMPFIEGEPITAYCAARSLTLEQRLQLFAHVTTAVQYAHGQLVVHRDIKPSNIFVTADGDVQLLDFGIAKLMSGGDALTGAETRSELRLLTPEHAAPEQIRGDAVGTATDVYALGVLLYELLTGAKPHRAAGRTLAELEKDILQTEPLVPSAVTPGAPWARRLRGDLDRIVMMALRKESARRYASVGQFADDIERFLKGLPVSAERDSWSYRARKFVRRNRAAVVAGSVIASLLLLFAIGMTWQARAITRERDRAQQQQAASEAVVRFLTSIFARANPLAVPGGDTLRVPQLLLVGETLVDSLGDDPFVQGRILRVLGNMHVARGKLDEAEAVLRRAYDHMMSARGSDSLEVAQTYHELARAVGARDGLTKALPMFRESTTRLRRAGARASDILVAERELAERTEGLEARQRALELLMKQEATSPGATPIERAANFNALGIGKQGVGNIQEAITLFEESLKLLDALLPSNHPNRLAVASNLAGALRDNGDYPIAESMARDILAMQRGQVTPNDMAIAFAEENVAVITAYRGFLEEAEHGFRRALALELKHVKPTHATVLNTMFNLGAITATRGRLAEGLALMDSTLSLSRRAGGGDLDTLAILDTRAEIMLTRGETAAAWSVLQSIDAGMRRTYPDGHHFRAMHEERLGTAALAASRPEVALAQFTSAATIRRARARESSLDLAGAECGRGVALARLGRNTDARPLLRDACRRYEQYGLHSRLLVRWAEQMR
ncbi:MAG: serine/threonine-protein kinase, partial [Gemmatimonas sp.]